MFCQTCATPLMLTYSPQNGWQHTCVKCGGQTSTAAPAHIPEEAGEAAQLGYSAFWAQNFTLAEEKYQTAVNHCPDVPAYRWALLLAHYGIKYCKAPIKRGTAFAYTVDYWKHELPYELMAESDIYRQLCTNLYDPDLSTYYSQECQNIDAGIQKARSLEREGEACDIFLCFKDTDDQQHFTPEHQLLEMVYPLLIEHGLKVFFSPVSMQHTSIHESNSVIYASVIYHALRTARLMVVSAGSQENAASPWVVSEWMRFRRWSTGQHKRIITATIGSMLPSQFPEPLNALHRELHADQVNESVARAFAKHILAVYEALPYDEAMADELYQKGLAGRDATEAVQYYRAWADKKYAPAQYQLGVCYAKGTGVEQDDIQACMWYRRAAEQHYAEAQYQLGQCYLHGKGVPQNVDETIKWHKAAADQDHAKAQFALGDFYERGYGVPKNRVKAFRLYEQAADHGDADMQFRLARSYEKRRAYVKAAKWYKRAADQGHARAALELERLKEGIPTRWILRSFNSWKQA